MRAMVILAICASSLGACQSAAEIAQADFAACMQMYPTPALAPMMQQCVYQRRNERRQAEIIYLQGLQQNMQFQQQMQQQNLLNTQRAIIDATRPAPRSGVICNTIGSQTFCN